MIFSKIKPFHKNHILKEKPIQRKKTSVQKIRKNLRKQMMNKLLSKREKGLRAMSDGDCVSARMK